MDTLYKKVSITDNISSRTQIIKMVELLNPILKSVKSRNWTQTYFKFISLQKTSFFYLTDTFYNVYYGSIL